MDVKSELDFIFGLIETLPKINLEFHNDAIGNNLIRERKIFWLRQDGQEILFASFFFSISRYEISTTCWINEIFLVNWYRASRKIDISVQSLGLLDLIDFLLMIGLSACLDLPLFHFFNLDSIFKCFIINIIEGAQCDHSLLRVLIVYEFDHHFNVLSRTLVRSVFARSVDHYFGDIVYHLMIRLQLFWRSWVVSVRLNNELVALLASLFTLRQQMKRRWI